MAIGPHDRPIRGSDRPDDPSQGLPPSLQDAGRALGYERSPPAGVGKPLCPIASYLVPHACPADSRPGYSLPVTIKKISATFSPGFLAESGPRIPRTPYGRRNKKIFQIPRFSRIFNNLDS